MKPSSRNDTLESWLSHLLNGRIPKDPPAWPPDLFAIAAAVLGWTGAYVAALNIGPYQGSRTLRKNLSWSEQCETLGYRWRKSLTKALAPRKTNPDKVPELESLKRDVVPEDVRIWWKDLIRQGSTPLFDIPHVVEVSSLLVRLACVADCACGGIGLVDAEVDPFLDAAEMRLISNGTQSLTATIPIDRVRVLPKQHTPQRGMTLRSLSHHLALIRPSGVLARWNVPIEGEQLDILNFLLLPWPEKVAEDDFEIVPGQVPQDASTEDAYRHFRYAPKNHSGRGAEMVMRVRKGLAEAEKVAKRIHAIVLPELALSPDEFELIEKLAIDSGSILVSGVNVPAADGGHSTNACWTQPLGHYARQLSDREVLKNFAAHYRLTQAKHHRWCLDRNQILQYKLGGHLPASHSCWELTDISERTIDFFTIDPWVTWAVLICEDLARQDPVADVLRAVGPNLLIALLMDGPQLRSRWPSRYASVLAEDPGTSVLTLTSLGMCALSEPRKGDDKRDRVIALWRDAVHGDREIELDEKHNACVLSLARASQEEFTADGRSDGRRAYVPVYAGCRGITIP